MCIPIAPILLWHVRLHRHTGTQHRGYRGCMALGIGALDTGGCETPISSKVRVRVGNRPGRVGLRLGLSKVSVGIQVRLQG